VLEDGQIRERGTHTELMACAEPTPFGTTCSSRTTTCWRPRKTSSKIVPGRVNLMSQKTSAHASQTAVNKAECVSMTGYAQARGEQNGWAIRVSVKSVNHRFLDVRFPLPEGFDVYELRLRQIIRERIHRGHIDVNVNVQPGGTVPVQVIATCCKPTRNPRKNFAAQLGTDAGLDVVSLLRLPRRYRWARAAAARNRRRARPAWPSTGRVPA